MCVLDVWHPEQGAFCRAGYARAIPFGCVDSGLLTFLYFLPGQAMRPHRHLDSDEYFTALDADVEMLVDGCLLLLPRGGTFFRRRGRIHALRNVGPDQVIVQSFQTPLPRDEAVRWETFPGWEGGGACLQCWCGLVEGGECVNCGADAAARAAGG